MSPKIRLELHITPSEVNELKELLINFSESEGFSLNDMGGRLPPKDGRRYNYLVLNRNKYIEIVLTDFLVKNIFFIAIYELKPDSEFQEFSTKFQYMLHKRWPEKLIPYSGM